MDKKILQIATYIGTSFPILGRTKTLIIALSYRSARGLLRIQQSIAGLITLALRVTDPYSQNPTKTFGDHVRAVSTALSHLTLSAVSRYKLAVLSFERQSSDTYL